MQMDLKSPMFKLANASLFALSLILFFLVRAGQASSLYQTIPTAPPATVGIPTLSPSLTPTRVPQTTALSTQPTSEIPSQTALVTASQNIVLTQTRIPELGTLPSLSATQTLIMEVKISRTPIVLPTSTMEVKISRTPTVLPTSTILNLLISDISNNNTGCLFGAVLFILLVGGLILFFRSRRKE